MVALNWDELKPDGTYGTYGTDSTDRTDGTEQAAEWYTGPRLYVSEDRRRPTSTRRSGRSGPASYDSPASHDGPAGRSGPAGQRNRSYASQDRRRWRFAVRRALVVVVIASLGALAWSVAERLAAVASTGGGPAAACNPTTPGRPGGLGSGGTASCPQIYVATAGDTVWSIALRFDRGGDPRPLVDRLEAEIGGGMLQPGQQLRVP
jgi:hypothetical protein